MLHPLTRRICSFLLCLTLVAGLCFTCGDLFVNTASAAAAPGLTYATPAARAEAVNKLRYRFIGELLNHLGDAYVKGKGHYSRAEEFDCSGLIAHAFISLGYSRYFSISETSWNPGKFRAYNGSGQPSDAWCDFSWRGSGGLFENVKDGQTIYLLPDNPKKNPVLRFTVRKSDKKKTDFCADISKPSKWTDDFRDAVSARGTILVKNHVSQTRWHVTTVVGYYDEQWFRDNGYDLNPAKASISSVKTAIRRDLEAEFGPFGLSAKLLTKVHRGFANGRLTKDKIGSKSTSSSFNDLDRDDDVYPAMWDLRQRKITSERSYSPLWQIDALNPRIGVSINNSTLAAHEDNSVAMVLEWEEFGECHLTNVDNGSLFDDEDTPVAGAVYAVYDKAVTSETLGKYKPLTTVTADENGLVSFAGLPVNGKTHKNTYYVTEVSPPDGCEPNPEIYTVTVTRDGETEIVPGGIVTSRYTTGPLSLQLDKADCLVSVERNGWDGLSAGSYSFLTKTVRTTDIAGSDSPLSDASVTYTIIADETIAHGDRTLYTAGSVVRNVIGSATGTLAVSDLPLGRYMIRVKTAPTGWCAVNPTGTAIVKATLSEEQSSATRILECRKNQLELSFSVTDRRGDPVSGGLFGLFCESDIYDYTGETLLIPKRTTIAIGSADENGLIRFDDSGSAFSLAESLPACLVYYVKELSVPSGHIPYGGKVLSFSYTSPDWSKSYKAEYHYTIEYDRVTDNAPAAPVIFLPDTAADATGRSIAADDELYAAPADDSLMYKTSSSTDAYEEEAFESDGQTTSRAGIAGAASLLSLLALLGAATVVLWYRKQG